MKDTKWYYDTVIDIYSFPTYLRGPFDGVRPIEGTDSTGNNEIYLLVRDLTPFIYKVAKLNPFQCSINPGVVKTSKGPVMYIIWQFSSAEEPNYTIYDSTFNIYDPDHMKILYNLSSQSHWHIILMGLENEVLGKHEYKNEFNLENSLNTITESCNNYPLIDYDHAVREYKTKYAKVDLLSM